MSLPDLSRGGSVRWTHAWGATSQHLAVCIRPQTLRFPKVKIFLALRPENGDMHGRASQGWFQRPGAGETGTRIESHRDLTGFRYM